MEPRPGAKVMPNTRMTKRNQSRVGLLLYQEEKDLPKKGADQRDDEVKGRKDDRSRKNDYYSGSGYKYRDQSDSYEDYRSAGYSAKQHNSKKDKQYKDKYNDKKNDGYFIKKDNRRYDGGDEYYVKSETPKTDNGLPATSQVDHAQQAQGSKPQVTGIDHHDHKNATNPAHAHHAETSDHKANHKGGSAKKHKYFEDDESGDDQIYHALIQGQKQDAQVSGKNHSQEHSQYGHHNSKYKESSDNKTSVKGQQSSGTKQTGAQAHAQDKIELTPPPGISQKGDKVRDHYQSGTSYQKKDEQSRDLQINKTRSRDQQSSYAHSNHIGGHINTRDESSHENYTSHHPQQTQNERKNSHHAAPTQTHGGQFSSPHQATSSTHAPAQPFAIGSQPLGHTQTPLIYMPQTVTQAGPDGTQVQQTVMVPMIIQTAVQPQAGASGSQPSPFANILPLGLGAGIQSPWQTANLQTSTQTATGSIIPTTIYCLVPIQVIPYNSAAQ